MHQRDHRIWLKPQFHFLFATAVFLHMAVPPGNSAPIARTPPPADNYIAAAPLTPVAVFGKDNRQFISQRNSALAKKIGHLYNPRSRTRCTAFCLDKSIIATAAHCLFTKAGRRRQRLRNFIFEIDYRKHRTSSHIEGARINAANQHVIAGSTKLHSTPPISSSSDWAIVRLEKPVCRDGGIEISPINVSELIEKAKSRKFYQIAFHRDLKKWQLAHSQSCVVDRQFEIFSWDMIKRDFSNSEHLILHKCDTGGGSSGGPLILNTKSGPKIVGISVGTYIQSNDYIENGEVTKHYQDLTVANTGVSAIVFRNLIDPLKQAKIITGHREMRQLQNELRNRMLYAGAIDGAYGFLTRIAIEEFERLKNWPVTGLPTNRLLRYLQEQPLPTASALTSRTRNGHIETGRHSNSGSGLSN